MRPDPREFRHTMGRFATGVTLITTRTDEGVHAMTANGFLSVSLEPAVVLVSLGTHTRMADLLRRTGRYGVNVLAEDHEAHSRRFAGQDTLGSPAEFADAGGIPLLSGALAHVGCRVTAHEHVGDHVLFFGRVCHLDHREGEPLVFYTGRYRVLHAQSDQHSFTH
ncbi:hypothetical protein LP52_09195 [Streptomonospora alba]|uniref:Flavin reductase like domain-containing protein n=2 Tax=Streptomonospora alba TaxID=183763 RepID=A0A0C2JJQ6_9ACTN|nr:hypothetical protein LP52_09195 [Streptomonospora alba]